MKSISLLLVLFGVTFVQICLVTGVCEHCEKKLNRFCCERPLSKDYPKKTACCDIGRRKVVEPPMECETNGDGLQFCRNERGSQLAYYRSKRDVSCRYELYGNYRSNDEAMRACARDTRCGSTNDPDCDNSGPFYLCPKNTLQYAYNMCGHIKQVFRCGNWPPFTSPVWGCEGGPDPVVLDSSLGYPNGNTRCEELCLRRMATDQDKYGCCGLTEPGGVGCIYNARSTADPGIGGNAIAISCRLEEDRIRRTQAMDRSGLANSTAPIQRLD